MEQLNYMKAEMRSGILKASFFMPRIQELPFAPAVIPYENKRIPKIFLDF